MTAKTTMALLIALGSLIVHHEEYLETNHPIDKVAIDSIRNQPEVKDWFDDMNSAAFLPLKRGTHLKDGEE